MRVALVHDFLTQLGGAERVLQAFHEIFPKAPVYTLVYDPLKTQGAFAGYDVKTSYINRLCEWSKGYKWALPLMPGAVESFDFQNYDLVLSDSSAFVKGVKTHKPAFHISYIHTPTRYLWREMDEYVANLPYSKLAKWSVKPYLKYFLKGWDYVAAQRPDFLIANSKTVQDRIRKYYNRDSTVIYPPIDIQFFTPTTYNLKPKTYYLTASRLEPYKKIDLVIKAFNQLGLPLKVAGEGSQFLNLKSKILNPNIEFLGRVSDEQLRELYRGASAFIFPAEEDAGIMVLEALACGCPVIGLNKGGTPEFIKDGETGLLMEDQSMEAIFSIVKKFTERKFDPRKLRKSALQYDREIFKKKIRQFIEDNVS